MIYVPWMSLHRDRTCSFANPSQSYSTSFKLGTTVATMQWGYCATTEGYWRPRNR